MSLKPNQRAIIAAVRSRNTLLAPYCYQPIPGVNEVNKNYPHTNNHKPKKPKPTVKTCPLLEHLKQNLLIEIYTTGRIDGKYFGVASRSNCNGIKEYIKGCLYKQHIGVDSQLVDDCYHVLFEQLQLMTATKLLGLYNESPRKLLATCLRIIALKCFAKDNRLNRPNHSLIESVRFGSVLNRENAMLSTSDDDPEENKNVVILSSVDDEPEPYEKLLGFRIEDLIGMLSQDERRVFYQAIGTQRRGKRSTATVEERELLYNSIRRYKTLLQAS